MTLQELATELTKAGFHFSIEAQRGSTMTPQKEFMLTMRINNIPLEYIFGEYEADKAWNFAQNFTPEKLKK